MPKERRIHWHLLWARRTRLDRATGARSAVISR